MLACSRHWRKPASRGSLRQRLWLSALKSPHSESAGVRPARAQIPRHGDPFNTSRERKMRSLRNVLGRDGRPDLMHGRKLLERKTPGWEEDGKKIWRSGGGSKPDLASD